MKYSLEESLRELDRRGMALRLKHRKRYGQVLACLVLLLGAATISALGLTVGTHSTLPPGTAFGSFLLTGAAGGYILAGVVAFIAGVVFTLICVHVRGRIREGDGTEEESLFRARGMQEEENKENGYNIEEENR